MLLRRSNLIFKNHKNNVFLINKFSKNVLDLYSPKWVDGFCGTVGNTPLIRLNSVSEETGCDIVCKAEFLQPGGSVKDRAAYYLILDGEKKGLIKPHSNHTIVEGTAGNTGIGLAHVCNTRGYKCVIYLPNTQSKEKIQMLQMLGAEVREVPAVPYDDPNNYNHLAKAYAEEIGGFWTNQFDNIANRHGHFVSTGPEIYNQTDGLIDAFTCSTGTGGTLAGIGQYMKSKNPDIKIVLADPSGSCLYNHFKNNKLERTDGESITEGIGQGRVTKNLEGAPIDDAIHIKDSESIKMMFRLIKEEGIFCGLSSALNVVAAVNVAKQLGPGHVVGTILCDYATRYKSRLFNKEFLEKRGLLSYVPEDSLKLIVDDAEG
eukprot:TRINITY_DN559_c2_g2_i1.p1 TRINITY_DN559_c2_g2~~TRINITY_DN559_c2_g2_i1.p1  ORF type:complete len:374 (-),score=120.07 TRINITY_DN559_c2_g2_i1:51-1172(-)